ncbi:hypothetical protein SAMN05421688_1464 [Poseidonocella pacifica]|uniref:Uncharacterized protein n=1 Tax=Poseidonocella pacifica TaxID=871651 RepID=A0A1I0WJG3_9RHOB|nr:hypothetical protein [Poseidonocella pacifica]SFA88368.1 hypothetical protein SAMN05421688_1464 [Poseidonocella pacifica]
MTPEEIAAHFTQPDGSYRFARWGRPISPVVFGVEDATLNVVKGAFETVVGFAGHTMAETDPELGANVMVFFFREWSELLELPNLSAMIPDLGPLVVRLESQNAHQYRLFRFDEDGAIRACFVFLRMEGALARIPVHALALSQVAQVLLLWSEGAFEKRSPLGRFEGNEVLRPDIAALLRAAYDPVLPGVTDDPVHALRLSARLTAAGIG